jgi:tetratricopeptide (TPR) repeat protein
MVLQTTALMLRPWFLASVFLFSATFAVGQIAGGLTDTTNINHGGNNYIVGTIYLPNGMPLNAKMNIRLTSPNWGDILAMTDDTGKFVFSGVASGTYTVVIEEKDFESVRQPVDITVDRARIPETYMMTIRLRYSKEYKSKADRPGVVTASNAGVPQPALDLYEKAAKLATAKDYKGAIKELKLAVAEYPNFVNALNQIGVLYLQLNELKSADEALQAALKIAPDAFEPLLNRGVALFRMSQFKDAETVLIKAIKADAKSAVAYYYLGRTLNKLDKNPQAEAAFLNSVKLSPGEFKETHRFLAAIYLDQGNAVRVVEELETYLKLVPKAPDAANLQNVVDQLKRTLSAQQKSKP